MRRVVANDSCRPLVQLSPHWLPGPAPAERWFQARVVGWPVAEDAGAVIFVCGRSHPMPSQVFDAFVEVLQHGGGSDMDVCVFVGRALHFGEVWMGSQNGTFLGSIYFDS